MKKRLNVYLTDGIAEAIHEIAQKTGLSMTAVGTLAVTAGVKSIEMALDPKWQAKFEETIRDNPEAFKTIIQGKVEGA